MKNDNIATLEEDNSSLKRSLDGIIIIITIITFINIIIILIDAIDSFESEQKKRKLDREEFEGTSVSMRNEYDNKIESITQDHAHILAIEMERSRSLAANVEEEKVSSLSPSFSLSISLSLTIRLRDGELKERKSSTKPSPIGTSLSFRR